MKKMITIMSIMVLALTGCSKTVADATVDETEDMAESTTEEVTTEKVAEATTTEEKTEESTTVASETPASNVAQPTSQATTTTSNTETVVQAVSKEVSNTEAPTTTEHTHNWVSTTIHHEAETHTDYHLIADDGFDFTANGYTNEQKWAYMEEHMVGYADQPVKVVDREAYDEVVTTCSTCGATQ